MKSKKQRMWDRAMNEYFGVSIIQLVAYSIAW